MEQGPTRGNRAEAGAGPRVRLALLALLALTALLSAATAQPAAAVSKVPKGAVKKLRGSSCPAKYAVRVARPATAEEIGAAKKGDFNIAGVSVHINRNMNWAYDPLGSETFRARLNDLRWLDPLLYAYRERGDERALLRAKRIVVDWVENNPLRAPPTDRTWFDKVAGDRAPYIAYVTRAAECAGLLKQEPLTRKLLGSVQQHVRFLAARNWYSPTNRGLFMDLGLIFSGRQVRFLPGATKARNRGERRFVANVNSNVIPGEGMWLEHSTTYQFLAINVIERFLEIEKKNRPGLENLFEVMEDTAAWMTETDLNWVQAGDSYQDKADRFAQRIAREQRGMRFLAESGFAAVKEKKSYLSLLSNYHSPIHRHSDDLSFDLYEYGHRVVSDTGIPDKDFGAPYLYSISTPAHSVVQVDGVEFPRDAASAYGSGLLASGEGDGWFALEATNPVVADQGVDHTRMLLYKPGTALIVADRLRSSQAHRYRSFFHFGPDFGLNITDEKIHLHAGKDQVEVFNESTDPTLRREVTRGESDPLQGFVYPAFRTRDPRWVASTVAAGSNVDNVTTISVNPDREIHARALGALQESSTFEISHDGEAKKTLTVTRQGDQLVIEQADLPDAP